LILSRLSGWGLSELSLNFVAENPARCVGTIVSPEEKLFVPMERCLAIPSRGKAGAEVSCALMTFAHHSRLYCEYWKELDGLPRLRPMVVVSLKAEN
jgi:hypothetical protein